MKDAHEPPATKQTWTTPALVTYGDVSAMTLAKLQSGIDGNAMRH